MQPARLSFHIALLAALLLAASPVPAQPGLQRRVEATLGAAPVGTRFGLVVTTPEGRELIAINPDNRFIPASNTKMLTTAAAFANLPALDQPDAAGGATVRLDRGSGRVPDVILTGHGDARLSSAADCAVDCLATLADAVAARTRRVRNVVGDDSLFPDQRWSPGMSWNNIQSRYGTAISALTIDDNELAMRVSPGAAGARPTLDMLPYYDVLNLATTVAEGPAELQFQRLPNSRTLRLTGTIAAGLQPETLRLGIDDPAHFAAWRLRAMLEARGVRVTGDTEVRHRPFTPADDPAKREGAPPPRPPEAEALARLTPPPLAEDLTQISKVSQNLHAELMIRRLGLVSGSGSIEDGGHDGTRGRAADGLGSVRRLGHVHLQSRGAARRRRPAALGRRATVGRGVARDQSDRRRRWHACPPLPRHAAGGEAVRQDRNAQREQRHLRLYDRAQRPDPGLLILRQ